MAPSGNRGCRFFMKRNKFQQQGIKTSKIAVISLIYCYEYVMISDCQYQILS